MCTLALIYLHLFYVLFFRTQSKIEALNEQPVCSLPSCSLGSAHIPRTSFNRGVIVTPRLYQVPSWISVNILAQEKFEK